LVVERVQLDLFHYFKISTNNRVTGRLGSRSKRYVSKVQSDRKKSKTNCDTRAIPGGTEAD
jgi:hypothetical protein